jgi:glucose/arabinose dehydrogenase
MKKALIISLAVVAGLAALGGVMFTVISSNVDPFLASYEQHCASCHGFDLEGGDLGPSLLGKMQHGTTVAGLVQDISIGAPEHGMPAYGDLLTSVEIKGIAIYIAERRVDQRFTEFHIETPVEIPAGPIDSEEHAFRIELVTDQLHARPYAVATLPNGEFIVTEKMYGLRLVRADGSVSELIESAPMGFGEGLTLYGLDVGVGHVMDVALHPDYENNGWVYVHYGHRCEDCNETARESLLPVSMNRVIRGRIRDGAWHDEQVIWGADAKFYTPTPDTAAGGRLAFDADGYVYLSIGLKGNSNFEGPQDMSKPYGKTLRLHDDGRIPSDNPYVGTPGVLPEIWTHGHRSPQGLEFDVRTGELWGTEHGPRGGDEVNVLRPGRNYGWPLYSRGMDYDLTPVEYGVDLNLEFGLDEIEQPAFDLTPSPAVSNLHFYRGERFPEWTNDLFVGSLKATDLYRMEVVGDKVVHMETVIADLARIRDIETGPDGLLYLLLEGPGGGSLVRLVPVPDDLATAR